MKRLTAAGMVCAAWLACGQAPQAEPPAGLDAAVASDAGGALVDAGSGDAAGTGQSAPVRRLTLAGGQRQAGVR